MDTVLIYGATGYSGRMIAEQAAALDLNFVLGGRNEKELAILASKLGSGIGFRCFDLKSPQVVDKNLHDVAVVINCAGPFHRTAETLMKPAISTKTHYLDICAELDSYTLAQNLNAEAQAVGVLLLPGCGGSVAMLGCLAAHAIKRATKPQKIDIALRVSGPMSRGSAISAAEGISNACLRRENGQLVPSTAAPRDFDFGGRGPVSCFPLTLPDLLTIGHATGIASIETFVHVAGNAFPQGDLADLPDGPTESERENNRYQAAVEVTNGDGSVVRAMLDTINGYTFTALAAAQAAKLVVDAKMKPGFQTPADLFGSGFVETVADSRLIDR